LSPGGQVIAPADLDGCDLELWLGPAGQQSRSFL